MRRKIQFYFKILSLILRRKFIPNKELEKDYNSLAPTYDNHFSLYTGAESRKMVEKLNIKDEFKALDLACGTGVITHAITKHKGKVVAVDASAGMIRQAKAKTNGSVEFIQGDMLKTIDSFSNDYFDYVTCGWAIGYSNPAQLLKKIKRVLKPGGKVGIIENRRGTLEPLRDVGIKVMQEYPLHIRYVMDLPFKLPKSEKHLTDLYLQAGFKPLHTWEGKIRFNFKSSREVLNWVLHTGASAGFNKIMDPKVRSECDQAFVSIMERDYLKKDGIDIYHKFVGGVAQK